MNATLSFLLSIAFLLGVSGILSAYKPVDHTHLAESKNGMVVCVSSAAAEVGVRILKEGGNAVDSAVAVAFALAVTHPSAGNIGGGGYMLIYPGTQKTPVVIDYREVAPKAVDAKTFIHDQSATTHRAVGVPGTVRGLAKAHELYGNLSWKQCVLPAVKLASEGFVLSQFESSSLNSVLQEKGTTKLQAEFSRVFSKPDGTTWKVGDRLIQKDLSKTLQIIADHGADSFYRGTLADLLIAEIKRGKGLITHKDLENYTAVKKEALKGTYRGLDVFVPPLSSGGGTCLIEMLNILECYDLRKIGSDSEKRYHLMIEAMRRAYRDRAEHLGDSDFVKVTDKLTSKDYARTLVKTISLEKATPSEDLAGNISLSKESEETTHFSVVDANGFAVSNTYTLEQSYGSKIVVEGAGYILNNEMGDFNWKPGVTDKKGRIGTLPNQMAPGKRMLSSQCPTIIAKNGKLLLVTGSPGGRTIPNTVLNILVNTLDFDMSLEAAIAAPRFHHQWFPDIVQMEAGPESKVDITKVADQLQKMKHQVQLRKSAQGDAHSIWIDPKTGIYYGVADHRLDGKALGNRP